jgi:threonine/homoserine/homoserine lactone efflux protein
MMLSGCLMLVVNPIKGACMLGIHDFPLFVLSCILLNITPGQDTMYIIGRSAAQGRQAGVMSALGIMAGVLVHTLLAALGLSVILATSSLTFATIKYAGAAYLVWIGIGFLMNRNDHSAPVDTPVTAPAPWKIFKQGVLTNVLNPKVALFFSLISSPVCPCGDGAGISPVHGPGPGFSGHQQRLVPVFGNRFRMALGPLSRPIIDRRRIKKNYRRPVYRPRYPPGPFPGPITGRLKKNVNYPLTQRAFP